MIVMIQSVTSVVNEVRLLNNRLIELVDELHRASGITASQRAVLEFLHRHGPATVPAIARARGVTRQHIQVISNELTELELIESKPNPAHQRSPIYELTDPGRRSINDIIRRESDYLAAHGIGLDEKRLDAAAETLAELRHALRKETP